MTEKRFTYDKPLVAFSKGGINDNVTGETYEFTIDTVLDLLNELHEENQYLQTRIQMLEGVMNTQHYYQKIADNRTDEVFQIRQTIEEAYETERTSLGKSVLKQLLEAIQ